MRADSREREGGRREGEKRAKKVKKTAIVDRRDGTPE
jgi:hypothetical protein